MDFTPQTRVRRQVARARALVYRVLDTVPPVRRTVDEVLRVELVDRSMVIAAQGLLALVPLVVVLAAFLPDDVTALGLDRFRSVTGLDEASRNLVTATGDATAQTTLDAEQVRTQTGVIGLVVTVLSASSFARAVMRMYERVWGVAHVSGIRGRRRALAWLLVWLVALQTVSLVSWLGDRVDLVALEPFWVVVRLLVATLVWWWTLHMLLGGRVGWPPLLLPGALTAVSVLVYSGASGVVMPRFAVASAQQFGTFGLVLTVATWLIGLAVVLVASAIVGRVLYEDRFTRSLLRRPWTVASRRRTVPGSRRP